MTRKKTHEEYVAELKEKNPNIEVIGRYVDSNTKIMHYCLIHDFYWEARPCNILTRLRCPKCGKDVLHAKMSKTHKEYIQELAIINPNLEVIGEYVNSKTKILHHCKKHDVYWMIAPINALKGVGCKMCGNEKIAAKNGQTHEQYLCELKQINPDIIPMEQYINARTPILHKCLKHNVVWKVVPGSILQGSGCVECGKEKWREDNLKTHEQYVQDVRQRLPHIEVVDKYAGCHVQITHYCTLHDVSWQVYPTNLLNSCGCPQCAKEQNFKNTRKTHDAYVTELAIVNPTVEVIEQYINNETPILHHCLIHDVYWKLRPQHALSGVKCRKCQTDLQKERLTKTQEGYISDVAVVNSNIIVVGKYINAQTKILHKCKVCGCAWLTKPNSILCGTGCPQCNESHGERQVRQLLENKHIIYVAQQTFEDCKDKNALPFDFYLPEYNICIEYQGEQHYEPLEYFGGEEQFQIQQKHDQIKRDYCKDNNIRLLEIPYWENVEESLNKFLFI